MVFVVMDDIVPEANSWYVHSVHMFHPLISTPQCSNMQCWFSAGANAVLCCCPSAVAMAGWPPLEVSLDSL